MYIACDVWPGDDGGLPRLDRPAGRGPSGGPDMGEETTDLGHVSDRTARGADGGHPTGHAPVLCEAAEPRQYPCNAPSTPLVL